MMLKEMPRDLEWLVGELDARSRVLDESTARELLGKADLGLEAVARYVEPRAEGYNRRCVARRETYELLVLTWKPGQESVAHDHAGSLCSLKIVQGNLTEQLFEQGPDGLVRRISATQFPPGQILVDPGVIIHALGNHAEAEELLVTVHIYSPPLPEIRRYAVTDVPPAKLFLRAPKKEARTIAIIGGGFTGAMALANLVRVGGEYELPLHIVMIDRQPAFGEGIAYRTNDPRHLLNVPVGRMSAWPDQPDDFLTFARARDASTKPDDFVSRKIYGQYVRQTVFELAAAAPDRLSAEIVHDEAIRLTPHSALGWSIQTAGGRSFDADVVVIAMGHRPPDPLAQRSSGTRERFINDPWASLILNQIGSDEPVLLLGSGLTAIDTILTLTHTPRTAPLLVASRRGLIPLSHLREPKPPVDMSDLVTQWMDPATPLLARHLAAALRRKAEEVAKVGIDWRQVIDGLRPFISKLWKRLAAGERQRFLHRLRPFWEVHRHRMAPHIADKIDGLKQQGTLEIISGILASVSADGEGIDATLSLRGSLVKRTARVSWVINCTGPGAHHRHTTHPILRPLIEAGTLCEDELHLGLLTDSAGRALDAKGQPVSTLLVAGTLRKSTLWESTAVPELRQQAQDIANVAVETLLAKRRI